MENETLLPTGISPETTFLIIIIALPTLLFLTVMFVQKLLIFKQDLEYLNSEIRRTKGSERKEWERKRRRLWLSWIPFVK